MAHPVLNDPRVGIEFGPYKIISILGQGGMGKVYKARHMGLAQIRALKILPEEKAARSRKAIQRFLREARSAAALKHPNVVIVHNVGEIDGVHFIDMEYVDGESLQARLEREGRLEVEEATHILAAAAEALAAAHAKGIIHRDIKPANILLTQDGQVKVADFGLAKSLAEDEPGLTAPGQGGLGTPLFMSPEQWDGLQVDERSDIYSLGVSYYVLLTGEPPFRNDGRGTLSYKHRSQPPPEPRDIAPDLPPLACDIIARCMAKAPSDRYPGCVDLIDDLRTLAEELSGARSPRPRGPQAPVHADRGASRGSAASSIEDAAEPMSMEERVDALRRFVEVESATQIQQTEEMWRKPLEERIAAGEAIGDVEVTQVSFPTASLHCPDNQSKFRVADGLLLSRGDPTEPPCFSCKVEKEYGDRLDISAGFMQDFNGLTPGAGWVLDRGKVDLRHILLGALDTAAAVRRDILALLGHEVWPEMDASRLRDAERILRAIAPPLDASQSEAFAKAYATSNYYLIQGPPGSGKTRVLAYLAATLAREGQRVLITAFTHRAINNALRMVKQTTGYPNLCKIGDLRRADDLSWPGGKVDCYESASGGLYGYGSDGCIVGATCFTAIGKRCAGLRFDSALFDEAGQMTLPVAIAGMLKADRYIFIGDHMQMPPVIAGEHDNAWVTRSIFETIFRHEPGTMLATTYRMNGAINAFPSQRFYNGRLQPSAEARDRRLRLAAKPKQLAAALDPAHPSVFVRVEHACNGIRSPEEALVAAVLVAEALRCGVAPTEIAVIAPYRAQGRLIRRRLYDLRAEANEVVVDTVERMQGQEREVIIISLTTSDPAHAAQRAKFVFQPNRLNVAITRARTKRIVIGSPALFATKPRHRQQREWVELLKGLCEESYVVNFEVKA